METRKALQTPVGKLMYVTHKGEGKFNKFKNANEFTASVLLSGNEAINLKNEIISFYQANHAANPSMPMQKLGFKELADATGALTGEVQFDFSNTTTFTNKSNELIKRSVRIYNATPAEITPAWADKSIGNGSIGCVSGNMFYYTYAGKDGVSLYLNDIQLVDPIEYTPESSFGAVDGGYAGGAADNGGFTAPVQGEVAPAPVAGMQPMAQAPVAPAPVAPAPVAQAPVVQAEPINFGAEVQVAQAPIAQAPVAQAPVAQAPVAQAPIAQAPVAQAPVAQAPVAQAPMQAQTYVANTGQSRI